MPFKCCIPGCNSNKSEGSEYVSIFRFPSHPEIREQWIKVIPREGFVPSKYSCVCMKHFDRSDIIMHLNHSDTTFARQRPKLHPHAIPKLNPKDSAFCARQSFEIKKRDNNYFIDEDLFSNADEYSVASMSYRRTIRPVPPPPPNQLNADLIENFEELKTYVQETNIRSDLNWQRVCTDDTICFFVVNMEDRPYLEVSIKISNDFSVTGWKGNVSMKRSMLKQLLGRDAKCDTYSKLHGMLGILRCRESCENLTIMKVENVQSNTIPAKSIKQYNVAGDDGEMDVSNFKYGNVTIMKVSKNKKSKVKTDEYEEDNNYIIPEITYETIELD